MSSLTKRNSKGSKQTNETNETNETNKTNITFHSKEVLQKSFTKTYRVFGEDRRRDAIIALIQHQHRGEPFVAPFVAHLMKIGPYKMDVYSKIEIQLLEYGIHLTFMTSTTEESEMDYPIPDLTREPDPRLKRDRTFMEWLKGVKN
jgi:hypothetical protein